MGLQESMRLQNWTVKKDPDQDRNSQNKRRRGVRLLHEKGGESLLHYKVFCHFSLSVLHNPQSISTFSPKFFLLHRNHKTIILFYAKIPTRFIEFGGFFNGNDTVNQ
eukprot:TRINITY_DN24172_c0_g1_i1.p1 TRINITY_DN24172_c0_g1~~TRINITY_DN24172_c0_g1_i1.p1  ORF type:complete len:107 (+),score=6.28 TRINITY_DN24172_c0_g1_i1:193-513(+)